MFNFLDRILNPFSNKLPKTDANDGHDTGKQNGNKHSPNDCKEKKRKINTSRYTLTNERMTKEQEDLKKELDMTGFDKEDSVEWLRRDHINWDGERVIISAQDQGHYMNAFKKMGRLSQSAKCRFCREEI